MSYRPALLLSGFAAVLLGMPTSARPQEMLTLQQALGEARLKNPDLQAERLRLSLARSRQTRARLLLPFNPEVEFETASDRFFNDQGEGGYSLSLSQEIEIAGQRGKRRRIAALGLEQVQARIARFEQVLAAQVKASYHRLALGREKLKVAGRILALNERLVAAATQRYQSGDISELELNLVAAERDRAAAERYSLEAASRSAEAGLNLLLGRPATRAAAVRADTAYTPLDLDLEQLERLSLAQRRDLEAMKLEEKAAGKGVALARAAALPNPRISLSYDRERTIFGAEDFRGNPGSITGLRDRDRLFRFQIALPLPLLNHNQAGVQEAKAAKNIAGARREALEARIRVEVAGAHRRFVGARQALAAYRALIPRVEQNADLLVRAYEAGELDLTTLLVQSDRIFRMRLAYFDALIEYREALAGLEEAAGAPLPAPAP